MSNSIDQRIVEMQFDNAQFEQGIASTLASLKALESGLTLENGVSGLEQVKNAADSISFDSAVSEVGGFRGALENLGGAASSVFSRIMDGVSGLAKGVGIVQGILGTGVAALSISGGWNRASAINEAEFKLQGILRDSNKVASAMTAANNAVNGTAYGFDAAATAAATLAASGVDVDTQLEEILVTIADLAGSSGRDFSSVAQIMGTVASQGRLMGMQLQQFSQSGLNVTAALAKSMGKTESEIRDMASKGQISFEDFAAVMKEQFGGNAKKANDTFAGSLANVRSALSRTTADLFQYGQKAMVPVFNGIRVSIDALNYALGPLMRTWKEGGELKKGVLIRGFEDFAKAAGTALKEWGGVNKETKEYMSNGPERMHRVIKALADSLEAPIAEINAGVHDLTWGLLEMGASVREVFRLAMEAIGPVFEAFTNVFKGGSFAAATNAFFNGMLHITEVLANLKVSSGYVNIVRTAFEVLFSVVKSIGVVAFKTLGGAITFVFDILTSIGLAFGAVLDFIDGIFSSASSAGSALKEMLAPIADFLTANGLGAIPEFFSGIGEGIGNIVSSLKGEDGAFDKLVKFFDGVMESAGSAGDNIASVFKNAGSAIVGFASSLKEGASRAAEQAFSVLQGIWETISPFIEDVVSGLRDFFGVIGENLGSIELPSILQDIALGFAAIIGAITGNEEAIQALSQFGDSIGQMASPALERASKFFSDLGKSIGDFGKSFRNSAVEKATAVFERLRPVLEMVGNALGKAKDTIVGAWNVIVDAFSNAGFSFDPIFEFFSGIGDAIGSFIDSVGAEGFGIDKLFDLFGNIFGEGGELVSKLADPLGNAFSSIGDAISDNLEGPLKTLWDWCQDAATAAGGLGEAFQNAFDTIGNLFSGKMPWEKDTAEVSTGGLMASLAGVDAEQAVDQGFNIVQSITNTLDMLMHPIESIKNAVSGGIGALGDFFNELVSGVPWEEVANVAQKIGSLAATGGMIYSLYEFGTFLKEAGGLFKAIKDIPEAIKGVVEGLGDVCKTAQTAIRTQAILNIAIAVGILVASLAVLSFTDLDKVREALPIVEGLLIEMAVIVVLFGRLTSLTGFDIAGVSAFGGAMLAMAVAVGVMALVVGYITSIPEGEVKKAESILIEFGLLVAALVFVMGHIPFGVERLGSTLLGLAASFILLAACVKILGTLPKNEIDQGGAALAALAVGIGMLAAIVGTFGKGLSAGAAGLLELAGVVAILAGVMKVLGEMDPSALNQGAAALLGLSIGLAAVIAALHFAKPQVMMEGATSLILVAVALGILAAALSGLALVVNLTGESAMLTAAASLLILSAGLALIAAVIGNAGPAMLEGAAILTQMAIVIGVLTAAIALLSMLDTNSVWMAVAQIGTSLIIFAGSLALLSKMSAGAAAAVPGIIAMTVAVGVLTAALILLSQVDPAQMIVACAGLLAGILILAAGLGILAAVAANPVVEAGIAILSGFGIVVAACTAVVAVAAALFVASLAQFMDALSNLADNAPEKVDLLIEAIRRFGRGIWDAKEDIALGVMGMGYAFISGILGLIPMAVQAIAVFLGELLGAIITFAPAMGYGAVAIVAGFIDGLATGIDEHGGEVLDAVGHLLMTIVESIGGIFSEGINMFNDWLYEVTGGLMGAEGPAHDAAQGVTEAASAGAREGDTTVQDTQDRIQQYLAEYEKSNPDAYNAAKSLTEQSKQGATDAAQDFDLMALLHMDGASMDMNVASLAQYAEQMGMSIPDNLQSIIGTEMANVTPISQVMDENGVIDQAAIDELTSQAGIGGIEAFQSGAEEAAGKLDYTQLFLNENAIDEGALRESFNSAGAEAAGGFEEGFTEGLSSVDGTGPVKQAADALKMESEFKTSGKIDGQAATNGMADGMKNMASKVQSAMDSARKKVDSSKGSMESSGKSVGSALISGMVVGVNSQIPSLEAAVARAEALAERMLRAKAKMNSPSKVFAELGSYMMQGLVIGIESMYHNVGNASAGAADMAIKSMTTQASYISGLMDDIEDQPVIRPILDLTDYNAGLAQMQGIDTSSPMLSAQAAGRVFGSTAAGSAGSSAGGHNIQIYLNYDASADANQIVMDIASGLETRLAMEGV